MEALLRNFESTVQLLAVSRTPHVQQWDRGTVERAFEWTLYCEHLLSRFLQNPPVRAALERRLREANELLQQTFPGCEGLSLHELTDCQHRLLLNLLKNPSAPHPLITALLDKFSPTDTPTDTPPAPAALIASKSACTVLNDVTPDVNQHSSLESQVSGMMLLQRIHAISSHPENQDFIRMLLDSVIKDSSAGPDLIASALLAADPQSRNQADSVLDWLHVRQDFFHNMCMTLPAETCTKLSQLHQKFSYAYWDILKSWASSLEYDVSKGLWVQQEGNAVSYHAFRERILDLWRSGSALKQQTEEQLMELKQTDGDYEVQGLSVWTDVLLQLK